MVVQVLDSFMCLGPVRDMTVADIPLGLIDPEGVAAPRSSQCLIAGVGSDKAGAIAVIRRGVVSDVITAVPLDQVHGTWALHYRPGGEQQTDTEGGGGGAVGNGLGNDGYHAFLLLSCEGNRTMVLDARGEELAEITESVEYITDAPTVAAGEMFGSTAAVQVTPTAVRLIAETKRVQDIPLHTLLLLAQHPAADQQQGVGSSGAVIPHAGITIKSAHIQDPYVFVQLTDGTAVLLQGQMSDTQPPMLEVVPDGMGVLMAAASGDFNKQVTAVCLYVDSSGWLAGTRSSSGMQSGKDTPPTSAPVDGNHIAQGMADIGVEQQTAVIVGDKAGISSADTQPDGAGGDITMADGVAAAAQDGNAKANADAMQVVSELAAGTAQAVEADAIVSADADAVAAADGAVNTAAVIDPAGVNGAVDGAAGGVGGAGGTGVVPMAVDPTEEPSAAAEGTTAMQHVDDVMTHPDATSLSSTPAVTAVDITDHKALSTEDEMVAVAGDSAATASTAAADLQPAGQGDAAGRQNTHQDDSAPQDMQMADGNAATGSGEVSAPNNTSTAVACAQDTGADTSNLPNTTATVANAPDVYCFICCADGSMQVYTLPVMTLVFEESELIIGHQVGLSGSVRHARIL